MQILADACLALFASIGLWTLGKMAFDWFFVDWRVPETMTVMRVQGDCDGLERSMKKLMNTRYGSGLLIVDCGLTKIGIDKANLLMERYTNVEICSCEELSSWMKEAERWTKRKNTIK